jgi:hypothetical protein
MKTNHAAIMECLHKLPAATTQTENGEFWFCEQKPSCHFICSKDEEYIYENTLSAFHATEQPQLVCCDNNAATFRVVKDIIKDNYGRPFFVCSKKTDKCGYFEWGDKIILQRPKCYHNKVSKRWSIRQTGPNKGRRFFCCSKKYDDENKCNFFQWEDETPPPTTEETPPPAEEETQPPNKKRNTTPENEEDDDDDISLSQYRLPKCKNRREKKILKAVLDEKKSSLFLFYTRGYSG